MKELNNKEKSVRKGPTVVISVRFSEYLESSVARGSLFHWHEGHVHGKTKACPAVVCHQQPLVFLFSCFCIFFGVRGVVHGLASLYNNIKHLKMMTLLPGPPLVQFCENVKSEFSGNMEHLQLPPPKQGFRFTWKIMGKTCISPILALSLLFIVFSFFSRNTPFIIPLWYIKPGRRGMSGRPWDLHVSGAMVVHEPAWVLSISGRGRPDSRKSMQVQNVWIVFSLALRSVLLFGRALCGQAFEYVHLIYRGPLLLTWVKAWLCIYLIASFS